MYKLQYTVVLRRAYNFTKNYVEKTIEEFPYFMILMLMKIIKNFTLKYSSSDDSSNTNILRVSNSFE